MIKLKQMPLAVQKFAEGRFEIQGNKAVKIKEDIADSLLEAFQWMIDNINTPYHPVVANNFTQVTSFAPAPTQPTIMERVDFRHKLNMEEYEEYIKACKEGDLVEVLDGLVDRAVIHAGDISESGMLRAYQRALVEITASNVSKIQDNGEMVLNGVNCPMDERYPKGKYLKPKGYIKPQLLPILFEELDQEAAIKLFAYELEKELKKAGIEGVVYIEKVLNFYRIGVDMEDGDKYCGIHKEQKTSTYYAEFKSLLEEIHAH